MMSRVCTLYLCCTAVNTHVPSSVSYALYGSDTEEPHTAFSQAPLVEFCNLTDLTDLSIDSSSRVFYTQFLTDQSLYSSSNAKDLEPHSPTEEGPVQKPALGGLFSSKIQNFHSSRSREERNLVGLKGEIVLSRDGDSHRALSVFVALALHAAPHLSVFVGDLRPTQCER